ncbi:MAG: hypothetical protein F6K42_27995, partial [Leptolyngbya sp. SIO1D8]|nr:hypothetical protein [Leptolyngbya sp. SIO1D8]
MTVESLFSEFFFRKHEILNTYSAFEQLNRMGKLLLIFDGFDERAARVNRQAMIDNFWELAKVVVPGAKAILTCRTEHFPDAIEGRQLLNAELQASTKNLTGEPPQFEVLELEKFSDAQIAALLGRKAQARTVQEVMGNPQLLDLARRPVMVDLILEALPEIEAGKPVDMARVYLYAVTAKMERDIKSERTFTSLADKLYFLCELSWEMLSTDRMSLNYRAFPERLQQLFADRVKEERELDHWRYDMMGQTMLIRNSEGDYSPAHRSLLEFFVAYKIVASLGAMAEDFTDLARRRQSYLDEVAEPKGYTWEGYFRRQCDEAGIPEVIVPLGQFESTAFDDLLPLLSRSKLARAVLDLAHPMLDRNTVREQLLPLLWATRDQSLQEVGYLGGNVAQLMLAQSPDALIDSDLSGTKLQGVDFTTTRLQRVNFQNAHLADAVFSKAIGGVTSMAFSPVQNYIAIGDGRGSLQVWNVSTGRLLVYCLGHSGVLRSVAFSPDGQILASASADKTVKLWSANSGSCISEIEGHAAGIWSVAFSPDGQILASGGDDNSVKLWSVADGDCIRSLEGHTDWVVSVAFSPDRRALASGSNDNTVKLWSMADGNCIRTFNGHSDWVISVDFSPSGEVLVSGSRDGTVKLWSVLSDTFIRVFRGHSDWVWSVAFSPDGQTLASGSADGTLRLWSMADNSCIRVLQGHCGLVRSIAFSPNGKILASGSHDRSVKLWSIPDGQCIQTLGDYSGGIKSAAFNSDGKIL